MNYNKLQRLLKNRVALSTVVTTLIILVISVLLASVVTYFAINVVSTRVQEESLALTKQHVWYDSSGANSQAAIMIINTGGRDVVIDKITIRGQTSDWNNVLYGKFNEALSDDLSYDSTVTSGNYTIGSTTFELVQATDDLTLPSGYSMVIYIDDPDSITVNDVGLTVSVTINTAQAMYYVECNVQAVVTS